MKKIIGFMVSAGFMLSMSGCGSSATTEGLSSSPSSSLSTAKFEYYDDGNANYDKSIFGVQSVKITWDKRTDNGTFLTITPQQPIKAQDLYYFNIGSGSADKNSFLIFNGSAKKMYTIYCSPVASAISSNYTTPNVKIVKFRCDKGNTFSGADLLTDFAFVMPLNGSKLEISETGKILTTITTPVQ